MRGGWRLVATGAVLAVLGASAASAACEVPPDVLPTPLPNAPAASAIRTGVNADGSAAWIVSGSLYRCVDAGPLSAEIVTPPVMGITRTAALHLAISGVLLVPEIQLVQNKSTEWKLNSVPAVKVADPNNADAATNRLQITWDAAFVNVVSYQISYTLYLTQK